MKKFHIHLLWILLMTTSLAILHSCSDTRAGNMDSPSTAAPASGIPYLKGRKKGLGSVDEIANVASIYDQNKAAIQKDANNAKAYLKLAELFMNEARITGEHPYYYPAALKMIDMIPNLAGRDEETRFEAAYYKATIQLSQHAFADALVTGEQGRKIFPQNAGIHGVLIDANVELGHYDEAVRLSDIMVGLRPDLRSYSRISYLREIHGDPKGAIEAMHLAVDAAMPGYEQSAWCRLTLAKLHETYGQLDEAKMHYAIILQERPEYPFAYSGLASVAMKQGRLDEAAQYLDQAIALIPEVAFYEQKVELMHQLGKEAEANQLVEEVMKMMAEDQASGHLVDLELALAELRLRHDAKAALATCQKAYTARPDNIDVNAAMAEIEYALGDYAQADAYIKVALRTGSKDPAKNCLAGLIAVKVGDKVAGIARIREAFSTNPQLDHPLAAEAKAMI